MDEQLTRGAQCTSPWWRSDDEWQHLEDSIRSGEMDGCTICEELGLTTPEVEATPEDLANYHPEEDEIALDDLRSLR